MCVGRVKGRKITRNWSVRTGCGFVSYGIDIVINNDPEACVFALFASFALFSTQYSSTALQANCRFESTSHSTCGVLLFVEACQLPRRLLVVVVLVGD